MREELAHRQRHWAWCGDAPSICWQSYESIELLYTLVVLLDMLTWREDDWCELLLTGSNGEK
jgi:hypothetical protein